MQKRRFPSTGITKKRAAHKSGPFYVIKMLGLAILSECTQEQEQVTRRNGSVLVQVSRTRVREVKFTRTVIRSCSLIVVRGTRVGTTTTTIEFTNVIRWDVDHCVVVASAED